MQVYLGLRGSLPGRLHTLNPRSRCPLIDKQASSVHSTCCHFVISHWTWVLTKSTLLHMGKGEQRLLPCAATAEFFKSSWMRRCTVLTDTLLKIIGFCSFNSRAVRRGLTSNCFLIIVNVRWDVFRTFPGRPLCWRVASPPSSLNRLIQSWTVRSLTPTKLDISSTEAWSYGGQKLSLFALLSNLFSCPLWQKSKETPGVGAKPAAMSGERFFFF